MVGWQSRARLFLTHTISIDAMLEPKLFGFEWSGGGETTPFADNFFFSYFISFVYIFSFGFVHFYDIGYRF